MDKAVLDRINHYRAQAGLDPVKIDPDLSDGCRAHAQYLVLSHGDAAVADLGGHTEKPGLTGYTEKGQKAAGRSVIAGHHRGKGPFSPPPGWPADAVDQWVASFYHRLPILHPSLQKIGVGYATNMDRDDWRVVVDVGDGAERGFLTRHQPVIYPADKQKGVPLLFSGGAGEVPNPIPPGSPPGPYGHAITATFPDGISVREVEKAEIQVPPVKGVPAYVPTQVPRWLSSPDEPAIRDGPQGNTICLIPKKPLQPHTTYKVSIKATVDGERWEKTWTFTTGR
jgi:hypothetical protein